MAKYRYGHRGYNPQYEVEPWHDEWNHSSDNWIHPMSSDPDGRPYPTARTPLMKNYVVQTAETYIIRPSNYRRYNYRRDSYPPNGGCTMDIEVTSTKYAVHTSANTGRRSATEAAHAGSAGSNNPDKTGGTYASVIPSKPKGADATYANAAASRPNATDAAYGGSLPRKPETKAAATAGREYTIRPETDTMDGAYEGTVSGKLSTTDAAYAGNVTTKPKSTDAAYASSVSSGQNTTNSAYKSTMTSREAAKRFNGLLM